tara:strand:- start:150 stop:437 length:288 start_codon:yes stop_codon:yes gene_type:complete
MSKKNKDKDMSLSEAAGNILPELGKAFMKLIQAIGSDINEETKQKLQSTDEEIVENPAMSWTKKQIQSYMLANEIKFNSGDTKQDLLDKIKWSQE